MNFFDKLSRIFFPKKCPYCKKIIPIEKNSCQCEKQLFSTIISDDFCEHCANEKDNCSCKIENSIFLNHVASVYVYSDFIREKIHEFKFTDNRQLAKSFSTAQSKRVKSVFPLVNFDYVTFVPMSYQAEKERGYNQSELLAKELSKQLNIPFQKCLLKIRETERQHDLSAKERILNIKDSIIVSNLADTKGKVFLLCDDVKTTGATLHECESALLHSGAADVYCICIASSDYRK